MSARPISETARPRVPSRETQCKKDNAYCAVAHVRTQADDRPFADRRRFLIWAAMAGFVGPERVTERILADLSESSDDRGRQ